MNTILTNQSPLHITPRDYAKLRLLLAAARVLPGNPMLKKLGEELDRAIVIDPAAMPPGVVRLESEVEYEDLATGEIETYVLTLPERSDIEGRRLSVLAPVGTALIGCRVGETVNWVTPGGVRQLRIRSVLTPASPDPSPTTPSILGS